MSPVQCEGRTAWLTADGLGFGRFRFEASRAWKLSSLAVIDLDYFLALSKHRWYLVSAFGSLRPRLGHNQPRTRESSVIGLCWRRASC